MANIYDFEKRLSSAWNEGPQVATFVVDFDAQEFTSSIGSSKKVTFASGDVVRLMDAIPTGRAMAVLAVSSIMETASTAATSSTIDIGFDGGETLVADINGKTGTTLANAALANPIYGAAGTYLSVTNTLVGAGVKGKLRFSILYAIL
jgi:hypothetical protein